MRWLRLSAALICTPLSAVTVMEIPSLVREKNHDVRAAAAEVDAAGHAVTAAFARHYPSLITRSTYIHLGDDITLQSPTVNLPTGIGTFAFTPPPLHLQKRNAFFTNLVLKLPLFAGGRISAGVDAARAQEREAQALRSKTEEEKIVESLERYFQVHLARDVTRILEKMREDLERLVKIGESLQKTGVGTKFAVLQIQVSEREVVAKLAQARSKSDLADLAFKTSIGHPLTSPVSYDSPLRKLPLPKRRDEFKLRALSERQEFRVLKAKADQVEALKDAKTGELLPTVYALGAHRLFASNSPVLEPQWAVGVVMEVPLTGFLESLPERQRALDLSRKVEALDRKAREEIPLQVEKIYSEALAAEEGYQSTSEAEAMAREAARLAEVRFKNGDGSAIEVLRASADYERAQIHTHELKEEFNRKLIELYSSTGSVAEYLELYRSAP